MTAFTKWCPAENGIKTFENAEAAVDLALQRMGQKQVSLLQCQAVPPPSQTPNGTLCLLYTDPSNPDHIWDYTDDTYIHNLLHLTTLRARGKIAHIGLTNVDAPHLRMLLDTGIPVATNQVSCSVLDRRAASRGRGLGALCEARGVGLLCYGTLLGGLLTERWLGRQEPDPRPLNWSLRKYLRFVRAAGGWAAFQGVLRALDAVARRHRVPIAAVATRWVLDVPGVSAVIVGTRLGADSRARAESNLLAFSFALDEGDRALIAEAQEALTDIPGDCGDEYRRPPYLTAAGDLSHHLTETDRARQVREAIVKGQRVEYLTGSKWEPICVSSSLLSDHRAKETDICSPGLLPCRARRITHPHLGYDGQPAARHPIAVVRRRQLRGEPGRLDFRYHRGCTHSPRLVDEGHCEDAGDFAGCG